MPGRLSFRGLLCAMLLAVGVMSWATPPAYAATTWYVRFGGTDTSCESGHSPREAFQTIQFAIDCASDSDVVFIGPGTYAEKVTLTKNLMLKGSGVGKTVVTYSADTVVTISSGTSRITGMTLS